MVKYVLTGATGTLGSRVLKTLLRYVPASDIAVSVYNPSGPTPELLSSGVEIRRGDYTQPSSLVAAFSNAAYLLLISYPSISHTRIGYHTAAIDAAVEAGIQHIVYTSLAYTDDDVAAVMYSHAETERYLRGSGVKYTIVREGTYNEVWPLFLGLTDLAVLKGQQEVVLPVPIGDGGIAWASQDDLGEGTAKILAALSAYENRTVRLTGTRAPTLGDVASVVSHVLGCRVSLQFVPEEVFVRAQTGKLPEETLRGAVTSFTALHRGQLAEPDPLLAELLGRAPKAVEATVAEMLTGQAAYTPAAL